jgi:signal transduction histidine kinase
MIPPDLPTLNLDPDRLARAIGNLLSNAIKYTPAGGTVSITAGVNAADANSTNAADANSTNAAHANAASANIVWIQVSDSGPGIIPAEQEQVFKPFFRSQQARRFPQGLGLGLTIARDLVEAHGGRLDLVSNPGEGSRFTIHLPIATQQKT